ncbi:hypothetical protein A2480_01135 [Candidatus Uhrbacteria bacterium RIFOXYC2_FULL_47_19]|uniref:Type 4 fimbrial biogenesis protein PilX N-terminal domain-containing protein n=1 Tax=Candidatus Uhrbacteria bacterium RIFOXYC2_FULL_47_19 TaxID=1802424 RepID=A0A1F7WEG6_9BACT|nr:MAG: hypothetical protein A2480_01135 [Candidatus Uhrbacteria bacterium RIFOXYC2_FULL_47_19]
MNDLQKKSTKPQSGFTLILSVVLLSVIMVAGIELLNYASSGRQVTKRYQTSVNTFQLAESGLQKAIFCLNAENGAACGGNFGELYTGESGLMFGDGIINIEIIGSGDEREITATGLGPTGESTSIKSSISRAPSINTETQFEYSLMVMNSVSFSNNATINGGPVYSNTNFTCGNNAEIENDVYISLPGGKLDNCEVGGNAYADKIEDSEIEGDCFYDSYWVGSDCEGTRHSSQPTPIQKALPTLDEEFWHQQALIGGTIDGNYSPPDNSFLGPIKINGNLTLDNNCDVTMLGPIWVTGNVILSNNSTITLDSSFGYSGSVLMADGTFNFSNNSQLSGSGQPNSYIVVYTSNATDAAINVNNNAGAAVYLAPNGKVTLSNNAGAIAVAANRAALSNNAEINYDPEGQLTEMELMIHSIEASGWNLDEGTWRKF